MNNAVIYARYSSHSQNEQTIEGQIRVCTEYAEKLNLKIIKTYVDKHKTGTDVNRPQFQQMIADAKTGAFSYVIVYMLDRFARNRYYSTVYSFQLAQNGVEVISAMENISQSEEGELYRLFLEWNAEQYSKRLSKRVKEGLTTSVENGTFTGGHLLYGYKVENKKVFIDEQTSPIVKEIFNLYANGVSKKEIAEHLNKKGFLYKNKPFKATNFDRMLINKKYTGSYLFGDRVCENTYPQIIDKQTFDKVQKRLNENKYFAGTQSSKKEPYLLTGKLFCGYCGNNMIADSGRSCNGKMYQYYSCRAKKKRLHYCSKKNEDKGFCEWYVTERTVDFLKNSENVKIIANDIINYYEKNINNVEIKRIKNECSKTKKELDNALNLIINTKNKKLITMLENKITELSQKLEDLQIYQSKLELEYNLQISQDDIINFFNIYIKGNLLDKKFQKRIIDNLVSAVYLYDDKIVIYFNTKNGKQVLYIGNNEALQITNNLVRTLTTSLCQMKKLR